MKNLEKRTYLINKEDSLSMNVYHTGWEICSPGYHWGPGIKEHFLIHYIVKGSGYYKTATETYHLKEGDAFLIYPGEQVEYIASTKTPWEYHWVGINGSDLLPLLSKTGFSKDNPIVSQCSNKEEISNCFLSILNGDGNNIQTNIRNCGLVYELLSNFIGDSFREIQACTSAQYVYLAKNYIHLNYSYPLSVNDIADTIGISRSHLFRSFKKETGISPKDYLTSYRIRKACSLLEHTNLSITAIANTTGFDNSLYFSKAFKKAKGITPSEYKQNSFASH